MGAGRLSVPALRLRGGAAGRPQALAAKVYPRGDDPRSCGRQLYVLSGGGVCALCQEGPAGGDEPHPERCVGRVDVGASLRGYGADVPRRSTQQGAHRTALSVRVAYRVARRTSGGAVWRRGIVTSLVEVHPKYMVVLLLLAVRQPSSKPHPETFNSAQSHQFSSPPHTHYAAGRSSTSWISSIASLRPSTSASSPLEMSAPMTRSKD